MTTPVFTNNASTTLAVTTTASATTITVTDASIFNTLIQDGAGSTNGVHELATLTDGTNIEIVKVTDADTGTDIITVVRAQEGTTGYAFLSGDDVKLDITAAILQGGWYGRDLGVHAVDFGLDSVDLVTVRAGSTQKAGGSRSIAIGSTVIASADFSIALGYISQASGSSAIAIGSTTISDSSGSVSIGNLSDARNDYAVALGYGAQCYSESGVAIGDTSSSGTGLAAVAIGHHAECTNATPASVALGGYAINRITKTHNIIGASLIRKDDSETDEIRYFSGQENIIFSQEYDFTLTAADNVITIEIPTGSTFFVTEVGFMPTVVDTRTVYPTIEFGSNTTTDALMTATAVTTETVKKRERFSETLNNTNWVADADNVGHDTQLTVSVTVAATATSFSGRCYFKGFLLEDE